MQKAKKKSGWKGKVLGVLGTGLVVGGPLIGAYAGDSLMGSMVAMRAYDHFGLCNEEGKYLYAQYRDLPYSDNDVGIAVVMEGQWDCKDPRNARNWLMESRGPIKEADFRYMEESLQPFVNKPDEWWASPWMGMSGDNGLSFSHEDDAIKETREEIREDMDFYTYVLGPEATVGIGIVEPHSTMDVRDIAALREDVAHGEYTGNMLVTTHDGMFWGALGGLIGGMAAADRVSSKSKKAEGGSGRRSRKRTPKKQTYIKHWHT